MKQYEVEAMGNRHPIHPGKHLNEIVHGRRSITADTALRIGQALGMTPEFWPNLQRVYDLDLVRPPPGQRRDAIEPLITTD